jgi:DNA-binding PadR family transcriptional regulator
MVSDTRYAILGLLLRHGPSHGYELAARFGELFGPGWQINRGQIYDMLGTIEEKGWVECRAGTQGRRRVRLYQPTGAGERAFAEWLGDCAADCQPRREALWLKLVLAGPQNARLLLESLAIQEQACVDRLRTYAEDARTTPAGASEWETLARAMIDEATTAQLHGELEWLSKMRRRIECLPDRLPDPQTVSGHEVPEQRRASA